MNKNLLKFIFPLLIAVSAFVFYNQKIASGQAASLNITCDTNGCSSTGLKPLFSANDVYPGWEEEKTVEVINEYDETRDFAVEVSDLDTGEGLSDVLTITISDNGTNLYQDNLTNFKNRGFLILGNIASGDSNEYLFNVQMQTSARNEYQEKTSIFDMSLGFDELPESSPGPSPDASASSSDDGNGDGDDDGTCDEPKAPTGLTASTVSTSVISLSWDDVSAADTYNVSYGLSSGTYTFGSTDIGDVNTYTVSGLSSGTTYYFTVYAVNSCGSSGASNEASATTGGVLGAFTGPATGFEQVLGEATVSPGPVASPLVQGAEAEEGQGQVRGVEAACPWFKTLWWLPLLIQSILLLIYRLFLKDEIKIDKRIFVLIPPFLLAVISQIVHWILGCDCAVSSLCEWYWVFNLLITLLFSSI